LRLVVASHQVFLCAIWEGMATFLLEVGTEELPASFVQEALEQWRSRVPVSLAEQFLSPESVQVYGTPRRLAVLIAGLPTQQPDREEELRDRLPRLPLKTASRRKPQKGLLGLATCR
jgi:glycyl-tRNA synthetase beta chain